MPRALFRLLRETGGAVVKIVDVAASAGCSVATVSRVLNGSGQVDPALAAAVRTAADRLGYRPNAIARNLRRQRTNLWLLVISDIENPFFTAVARGVEDIARGAGFVVAVCNADEDPVKEATYLALAADELAAGVILSPHSAGADTKRLAATGIPLVAIDRRLDVPTDFVQTDSRSGARAATEHLIAAGWQRIACITGPASAETAEMRRLGYVDAVAAADGSTGQDVLAVPFQAGAGRAAAAELLDRADPPDAFFVANSALALGVLAELRARGLRPGADIGLVAFDDAPWAALVDPPLSVVAQPAYQVGARAAELLLARIGAADPGAAAGGLPAADTTRAVILPTELIVRGSSARGGRPGR